MKYHHLTPEQRYTIDVLLRQKKSRKEIAQTIGVSQSTLCRELKRNSGQRGYHYQQAQVKAANRQRSLQNYRNLTLEIRNFRPIGQNGCFSARKTPIRLSIGHFGC